MSPAPAGWYPDAQGVMRWWDGSGWTRHTAAPSHAAAPVFPAVPEGTPTTTRWIWWIVFLPAVVVIPVVGYLIDLQQRMIRLLQLTSQSATLGGAESMPEILQLQIGMLVNPWYFGLIAISLAVTAVTIWFAALDHRDLESLGYVRPFHWAWAFLGQIVYVIGRSVVVRRRSGRGLAPLWATIAVQVALLIIVLVWTVIFMNTVLTAALSYGVAA